MNRSRSPGTHWQLADLLDFEALLAGGARADERDRLIFARDIRPRLDGLPDDRRRALGLRLWLEHCRDRAPDRIWPSLAWARLIEGLGWLLLAGFALAGAALAWGLCLGNGQRVHVVIFVGLTVVLPWAGFILFSAGRLLVGNTGAPWLVRILLRPAAARIAGDRNLARWGQVFSDSRAARQAATARAARLMQWGGLGFSLGVACAFLISLMVFDVRFYWEATPDNTGLMETAVSTLAVPWAGFWPGAVPDDAAVRASRLSSAGGRRPPAGAVAGAWWRFLLMTVLVWGAIAAVAADRAVRRARTLGAGATGFSGAPPPGPVAFAGRGHARGGGGIEYRWHARARRWRPRYRRHRPFAVFFCAVCG